MKRNNLHSFTLYPEASDHVQNIKRGRKSAYVSQAIIWYSKPREFVFKEEEYYSNFNDEKLGITEGVRTYQNRLEVYNISNLVAARDKLQTLVLEYAKRIEELEKSQSFISKMRKKWSK
tara:strand:- start:1394 stop:1750 length:357 start_codon:yes stop_codon:yes gene_type:complete